MMTSSYREMAHELACAESVMVCGHVHPDGDCLGSTLALVLALRQMGKQATPLLAEDAHAPYTYTFMSGYDEFVTGASVVKRGEECPCDVFVSVDAPNLDRIGDCATLIKQARKSIAIDHHPDTVDFADFCLSNPAAASASMLVWDLIGELGVERSSNIATCCYVALVTDTGRFQFQNTTADALAYASKFCDAGAVPSDIARSVYQSKTYASMQLEARLVDRIEFTQNGILAYSWVDTNDFEELHATKDDAEGLPDVIRSLAGVDVALVLRCDGETVRGSMRAKYDFDVSVIAHALGGGGHRAAAGFVFHGSLHDALAKVIPLFEGQEQR